MSRAPDGIIRKWIPTYETKALAPADARRLVKLCGMFGSAHGGERAAAALKADTLVRQAGETWETVIAQPALPPPDWQSLVRFCASRARLLNDREADFIDTLSRYRSAPSEKQMRWLHVIVARLREVAA